MLLKLRNRRGQNTAEYAVVIALIIGAVIAMQTYVKRGLQGRMKDATDKIATDTAELGATKQYEPYYTDQAVDVASKSTVEKTTAEGAAKTAKTDDTSTRQGFYESKDTSGAD